MPPTSPVIGVDELQSMLGNAGLRVVDSRWYLGKPDAGRAAYDGGHIPGAVYVDLDADLSDDEGLGAPGRHPLPSPQAFAPRMGELGIGSDDFVVVYDDSGGTIAARLWWMLDNLGHRGGVAVLDGGIQAWTAAGHELSTDEVRLPASEMVLADEWTNVIERDRLADALGDYVLLDARAPERYRGEFEPIDPAAGHIPTAINVPVSDNVTATGVIKGRDQLRAQYLEILDADRATVVSCGSGVTACHDALAMRRAGLPDPLLYVGSFSDWARSGLRVNTGDEPGD